MSVRPYEFAHQAEPSRCIEVCARCRRGLVHRRGPDLLPYCPTCGCQASGHLYVLESTAVAELRTRLGWCACGQATYNAQRSAP